MFLFAETFQVHGDFRRRHKAEIKALASAEYGFQQLVRFRGGEDEFYMGRRLLQGFKERIECGDGEHVDFVDDIELEARTCRNIGRLLAQGADLLDAVVGRTVDFDDVGILAG